MRIIVAPLTLAAALASAPAFADETVVQEPDKVRFKTKTVMEFTAVDVSASVTKPDGSFMLSRRGTRFASLIRTRANFRPELERSVDAL